MRDANMELHRLVESVITQLSNVKKSRNWKGELNWQWLGATDKCWRCGKVVGDQIEPGSLDRHHIIPKSEGGSDNDGNLSLLCGNCHNVVHRHHMGLIGSRRTRDGEWRTITNVKGSLRISQKMPNQEHKLGECSMCGDTGKITGVSEGYWDGKGMIVFLDCKACGHLFAIPFLNLTKAEL